VRRLNRDDAGITMVIVTVGMATLLLMAALALDVGTLFLNKTRAQNSADAQALAGAINCAADKAVTMAPLPALQPNQTLVPDPDGCGGNEVTVHVTQPQDFQFVPRSVTVDQPATATWGRLSLPASVPLSISACDFTTPIIILHGSSTCNRGPSGQDVPGGFGWLAHTSACQAKRNADGTYTADTGRPDATGCDWSSLLETPIQLPVFDGYDGHVYQVGGFATFILRGYSFQGKSDKEKTPPKADDLNDGGTLNDGCPGGPEEDCIQGEFLGVTETEGDPIPGFCKPYAEAKFDCKVSLIN
jgi:hypothetical protein